MQTLLEIGLSNAVVAAVLALLAGASRLVPRPALTHSPWLPVLLKLITPPLFTIPITWSPLETTTSEQDQPERQAAAAHTANQEMAAVFLPTVHVPSSSEVSSSPEIESQPAQRAAQTLD